MRNRQRSAVHSRCGVLRIAWFGITWWENISRVGEIKSSLSEAALLMRSS